MCTSETLEAERDRARARHEVLTRLIDESRAKLKRAWLLPSRSVAFAHESLKSAIRERRELERKFGL